MEYIITIIYILTYSHCSLHQQASNMGKTPSSGHRMAGNVPTESVEAAAALMVAVICNPLADATADRRDIASAAANTTLACASHPVKTAPVKTAPVKTAPVKTARCGANFLRVHLPISSTRISRTHGASVRSGLRHVSSCPGGCASRLCASTRRLLRAHRAHHCRGTRCRACALWHLVLTG